MNERDVKVDWFQMFLVVLWAWTFWMVLRRIAVALEILAGVR